MTTPSSDVLVRPDLDAFPDDLLERLELAAITVRPVRLHLEGDVDTRYELNVSDLLTFTRNVLAYARAAASRIETLEDQAKADDLMLEGDREGLRLFKERYEKAGADLTRAREEATGLRDVRIPAMQKHWGDALNDLAKLEAENTRLREMLGRLVDWYDRHLGRTERLMREGDPGMERYNEGFLAAVESLSFLGGIEEARSSLSGSTSTETSPAREEETKPQTCSCACHVTGPRSPSCRDCLPRHRRPAPENAPQPVRENSPSSVTPPRPHRAPGCEADVYADDCDCRAPETSPARAEETARLRRGDIGDLGPGADLPVEMVCPACRVERADYEGPNAHLPSCPNCGSASFPLPDYWVAPPAPENAPQEETR